MPKIKLPIYLGVSKAVDEMGLVTHGADMVNVYVDDLMNINRWPGYEEFADTGEAASVDGLHWWENQSRTIAVCNQKTFQITDSNGTIAEITGNTFETGSVRVKFADFGSALYAANGAKINGISTSAVTVMADVDAPTAVTHVAILDRYLIGNEVASGNFHWADVNAPTAWSGYYSEAEANPDRLVALDVQNLNLFLMGKRTLEKWYDDGSTPFIRLYQGLVQSGTIANYSFTWCNAVQAFCWLDENRRVVMESGGVALLIGLSINKYIQEFTTVSDAIGDYVEIVGRPFYVLTFPSEEKVLAYDFISKNWYRLGSWNTGTATYDRYRGNCYCLAPAWNLTLMGDRANGKIYKLGSTIYDENGSILRSLIQTAHYNHGAGANRKYCNGIYLRLKRTSTVSEDGTPDLMLQYRDDGNTTWSTERSLTMHAIGNTDFLAYTTRLGSYFSRQWRFYMTDSYPLCIASVEEDVDMEAD